MAQKVQDRVVAPVQAPRRPRVSWWRRILPAIILIAAGIIVLGVGGVVSAVRSRETPVPVISQPVAQPVQQAPVVEVAPPPPVLNWVKIGEASNGEQVMTLPIPWDRLVMLPATPDNRAMWLKIDKLNRPDSRWGPGMGGWAGYLITGDTVVIYGLASKDEHTLNYFKAEAKLSEVEGLSP